MLADSEAILVDSKQLLLEFGRIQAGLARSLADFGRFRRSRWVGSETRWPMLAVLIPQFGHTRPNCDQFRPAPARVWPESAGCGQVEQFRPELARFGQKMARMSRSFMAFVPER